MLHLLNPQVQESLRLLRRAHTIRPARFLLTPPRRAYLGHTDGSGFRVQGSGCRVQGAGCRVRGSGFGVHGLGFRILHRTLRSRPPDAPLCHAEAPFRHAGAALRDAPASCPLPPPRRSQPNEPARDNRLRACTSTYNSTGCEAHRREQVMRPTVARACT